MRQRYLVISILVAGVIVLAALIWHGWRQTVEAQQAEAGAESAARQRAEQAQKAEQEEAERKRNLLKKIAQSQAAVREAQEAKAQEAKDREDCAYGAGAFPEDVQSCVDILEADRARAKWYREHPSEILTDDEKSAMVGCGDNGYTTDDVGGVHCKPKPLPVHVVPNPR
jgi:FtsZ-interacting cell division protein ZipA